jgi:signal transduction histidine kinase
MTLSVRQLLGRYFRVAPVLPICVSMILVILIGVVGLIRDLNNIELSVLLAEINQARSHAERTVGRLERELGERSSLQEIVHSEWLIDHWRRTIVGKPDRLYSAVVDSSGNIVIDSRSLESDPILSKPAVRLPADWYSKPLVLLGERVSATQDDWLTGGIEAVDVSVPVLQKGIALGTYHAGIEKSWLYARVASAQKPTIRGWSVVMTSIGLVVLVSSVALYRLGAKAIRLEQELETAESRRLADVSRLILGMAHEFRNPLNAVRLNLFTCQKTVCGESDVPRDELVTLIRESVSEIERVDELIGQLLGYARVDVEPQPTIDVDAELRSVLQFLKNIHEHHGIRIEYLNRAPKAQIQFNQKYFRQVVINLLHNARQALTQGGDVQIEVTASTTHCTVCIQDSGPGIAPEQFDKIFEPFYTTKQNGVGMGLAVVQGLVESARGRVLCQRSLQLGGMKFAIVMPLVAGSNH